MKKHLISLVVLLMVFSVTAWPAETELTIQTKKTAASVNPDMYGIFFEDINFGADGGLYAELIKNRSFEFPQSLMGWVTYGNVAVKNDGPFKRNPHYVTLSYPGHATLSPYTFLQHRKRKTPSMVPWLAYCLKVACLSIRPVRKLSMKSA